MLVCVCVGRKAKWDGLIIIEEEEEEEDELSLFYTVKNVLKTNNEEWSGVGWDLFLCVSSSVCVSE